MIGAILAASRAVPRGMLIPGNIDLNRRPIVHNPDGTISTVRSISIGYNGKTYLIPTVVNSRVVSNDHAIRHFRHTGEHLGAFDSVHHADRYAEQLHREQARQYGSKAPDVFGPIGENQVAMYGDNLKQQAAKAFDDHEKKKRKRIPKVQTNQKPDNRMPPLNARSLPKG